MTVTVFGYLTSINIDSYDFVSHSVFSIVLVSTEKIYETLETMLLTTLPNTWKFVKDIPLRVVFSTFFSVFGNVVTHGLSCLIYYLHTVSSVGTPIYTRLVN